MGCWRKDDPNRPKAMEQGAKIEFEITNIGSFASFRSFPVNLPEQRESVLHHRFYPTHWIVADVKFINVGLPTKYSPHISLACIAVELPVKDVDLFCNLTTQRQNQRNLNSDNIIKPVCYKM